MSNVFQSTLPARGATAVQRKRIDQQIISIHAPRTGSDLTPSFSTVKYSNFNPRSPHGERRVCFCRPCKHIVDFNPRSPHGERRSVRAVWLPTPMYFNPRSPHGERQEDISKAMTAEQISIHAPRTGSDLKITTSVLNFFHFNPRSPHGERHGARGAERARTDDFNPRSPHGERRMAEAGVTRYAGFQSTLPARGATPSILRINCRRPISIHAPRTGSDPKGGDHDRPGPYFNPRSPHGERRGRSGIW